MLFTIEMSEEEVREACTNWARERMKGNHLETVMKVSERRVGQREELAGHIVTAHIKMQTKEG